MTRLSFIFLFFIFLFDSVQAELVALYTFDDGTATDYSGNGNHGSFSTNAPIFTQNGSQNAALEFDAALNTHITIPVNINSDVMPQITFGGWFRADLIDPIRGIISNDPWPGNFGRTIGIDNRAVGGRVGWSTFGGPFNSGGHVVGGAPVVANEWTFVAVRHDNVGGWMEFHVDDQWYGQSAARFALGELVTTIGRNPNHDQAFDGGIDNVFIYNEFLSNAELEHIRLNGFDESFAWSPPAVVPEPSIYALFIFGIVSLGMYRYKMK